MYMAVRYGIEQPAGSPELQLSDSPSIGIFIVSSIEAPSSCFDPSPEKSWLRFGMPFLVIQDFSDKIHGAWRVF